MKKQDKGLLNEAAIRRMMGLAGIPAVNEGEFIDSYRKQYFEAEEEEAPVEEPAAEEPAPEEEMPMEEGAQVEANLANALAAAGIQLNLDNDELVAEVTKRVAARLVREARKTAKK